MNQADFSIIPMNTAPGSNDFLICEVQDATHWGVSFRGTGATHVFEERSAAEGFVEDLVRFNEQPQHLRNAARFVWGEDDTEIC